MDSSNDYVRFWAATSLGELGPRAKIAVPKLLELLPLVDCLGGTITSASAVRLALMRIGAVKPPFPSCKDHEAELPGSESTALKRGFDQLHPQDSAAARGRYRLPRRPLLPALPVLGGAATASPVNASTNRARGLLPPGCRTYRTAPYSFELSPATHGHSSPRTPTTFGRYPRMAHPPNYPLFDTPAQTVRQIRIGIRM